MLRENPFEFGDTLIDFAFAKEHAGPGGPKLFFRKLGECFGRLLGPECVASDKFLAQAQLEGLAGTAVESECARDLGVGIYGIMRGKGHFRTERGQFGGGGMAAGERVGDGCGCGRIVLCRVPRDHNHGWPGVGGVLIGGECEIAECLALVAGLRLSKGESSDGFRVRRVSREVLAEDRFGLFEILWPVAAHLVHGDLQTRPFVARLNGLGFLKALVCKCDVTELLIGATQLVQRLSMGGHVLRSNLELDDSFAVIPLLKIFLALFHAGRFTRLGGAGAGC